MNKLRRLLPAAIMFACLWPVGAAQTTALTSSAPADQDAARMETLLERVRQRIQKYHDSLFSIAVTEIIRQQELKSDATPKGKPRDLVYESVTLHLQSTAGAQEPIPVITRTLKSVDGQPAKAPSPPRRSKCVDINPRPAAGDPLTFLLPSNPAKLIFSYVGEVELAGRKTAIVEITTPPAADPIRILDQGDCFVLSRSPQRKGRIWIDLVSYDVLKLQWQLAESFSGKLPAGITRIGILPVFRPRRELAFEKADFVIRFRPVTFQNPEQTLLLPLSSESTWVLKGAGIAGYQTTTDYTRYRRFMTSLQVKDSDGGN